MQFLRPQPNSLFRHLATLASLRILSLSDFQGFTTEHPCCVFFLHLEALRVYTFTELASKGLFTPKLQHLEVNQWNDATLAFVRKHTTIQCVQFVKDVCTVPLECPTIRRVCVRQPRTNIEAYPPLHIMFPNVRELSVGSTLDEAMNTLARSALYLHRLRLLRCEFGDPWNRPNLLMIRRFLTKEYPRLQLHFPADTLLSKFQLSSFLRGRIRLGDHWFQSPFQDEAWE